MAVFPSARRALTRPGARLPWHLAVTLVLVAAIAIAVPTFLRDASHDAVPPELVAAASSITLEQAGPLSRSDDLAAAAAQLPDASPSGLHTRQGHSQATDFGHETSLSASEATDGGSTTALVAEISELSAVTSDAAAPALVPEVAPVPETEVANVPGALSGVVERWAVQGIFIETEGQALDDYSLASIDAALRALPSAVLGSLGNPAFGRLHILVNLEGRTLSGDQPYGGPANFFSTNEATNELVLYPQQSVFTIVHELGHAYNLRNVGAGRYAMVLLDSEMRSFLAAAGWKVTSTDTEIRGAVDHMHVAYSYTGAFHWPRVSNDDPLEDFANSFALYFLDPMTLEQASPERYEWMAGTFGE